jgi:hypothetical protein
VTELQLVEPAQVFTRKVRDVLLDNFTKEKSAKLLQEVKLAIRDPLQLSTVDIPEKHDILMCALSSNHDFFSSGVQKKTQKKMQKKIFFCFKFLFLGYRTNKKV